MVLKEPTADVQEDEPRFQIASKWIKILRNGSKNGLNRAKSAHFAFKMLEIATAYSLHMPREVFDEDLDAPAYLLGRLRVPQAAA